MNSKKDAFLKEHGILNRNPEKVLNEKFKSNAFFEPKDLLQVKYEMLRQVIKEGSSVTHVAQQFGISRPIFYQIKRDFEEGGLAGLLPRQRGPKTAHKLVDDVMDFVEYALNRDKALKSSKIAGLINDKFGITVHPRSIERALERRKKNGAS